MIKRGSYSLLIIFLLFWGMLSDAFAQQNPFGQVIQISTRFRYFVGTPTWLLIVRDVDTGIVSPYIFDIRNNENYWIAFTFGHNYRVTVSQLKFGTFAEINDFCGLEDGVILGKSMYMTLTGVLTPDPKSTKCVVHQYKATFTIVDP